MSSFTTTPIQYINGLYVKRDDLFTYAGVNGVKARSVLHLLTDVYPDSKGIITCGVRNSSQCIVVAYIAKHLNLPCEIFVPKGKDTPEILEMLRAGATVNRVPVGYKTVVNARARERAQTLGFTFIPHSMEIKEGLQPTAEQVTGIPDGVSRIIVPCGSGLAMAGVLHGVVQTGLNIPVLGVAVGGNVEKRLDKFAPSNWRDFASVEYSPYKYEDRAPNKLEGITLDPIYEAKTLPYLRATDLLWITGIRKTEEGEM